MLEVCRAAPLLLAGHVAGPGVGVIAPGSDEQQRGMGDLWECPALDGGFAGSPVVWGLASSALSNHRTIEPSRLDGTCRNP